MKKYIGFILCCSLLLASCGNQNNASNYADNSENSVKTSEDATDTDSKDKHGATAASENSEQDSVGNSENATNADSKDKHGATDTSIGVNSMHVNDENLTDEQKLLIGYTDNNYFGLNHYELLQRYPDAFNDSQVVFHGQVKKIIKADDKSYEALVTLEEYHDNVLISQNEICIRGKHVDNYSDKTKNYRIIEGDQIKCFGISKGSQTVEIDGVSSYIPVFEANQVIVDNGIGHFTRYNLSYIKDLSQAMFPNGIKIREPIAGQDFDIGGSWDGIHDYSDMFMIGEPDNQSNANFTRYEFYQSRGYIRDNKSTADVIRQLKMSLDMQHYILTVYDSALKTFTIEYYDLSYNKLWSREFENASIYQFNTMNDNDFFDYTESAIYLDLNNNLYIIDMETGEDKISPVTVGEKTDIRKTADGILLMSDSMNDTVIKTDLEGNILWKLDLPLYDTELKTSYEDMGAKFSVQISAVQFYDESIKIEYYFSAVKHNSEFNYDEVVYSTQKIFVIDNNGNMLMNTEVL